MVIHQPRASIFALLDDVLILGVGANRVGRVVDAGPAAEVGQRAVAAWREAGNTLENAHDVANTILDVVASLSPDKVEERACALSRMDATQDNPTRARQSRGNEAGAEQESATRASLCDRVSGVVFKNAWLAVAEGPDGFNVFGSMAPVVCISFTVVLLLPNMFFSTGPELHELAILITALLSLPQMIVVPYVGGACVVCACRHE